MCQHKSEKEIPSQNSLPVTNKFDRVPCGGAKGIRTPDLLNAIQTRYQLRYNPIGRYIIPESTRRWQAIFVPSSEKFPLSREKFGVHAKTQGKFPQSSSPFVLMTFA